MFMSISHKLVDGFTKKYDVNKLVHVESFNDINEAIYREKCIKKWNRAWKFRLIEERNPDWQGKTTSLRIAVKKTSKNNQNFSICHLLNVGPKAIFVCAYKIMKVQPAFKSSCFKTSSLLIATDTCVFGLRAGYACKISPTVRLWGYKDVRTRIRFLIRADDY